MSMTVNELQAELQILIEYGFGDVPIRAAVQPGWPFEHSLMRPVPFSTQDVYTGVEEYEDHPVDDEVVEGVVYLPIGHQIGYLPQFVRGELQAQGWDY